MGQVNRTLVLDNELVFGSVNANREHYRLAVEALAAADRSWLERIITRRVPLDRWPEALQPREGDIKVVIEFSRGSDRTMGRRPERGGSPDR